MDEGRRGRGELGLQSFTAASHNSALSAPKVMRAHFWKAGLSLLLLALEITSTFSPSEAA